MCDSVIHFLIPLYIYSYEHKNAPIINHKQLCLFGIQPTFTVVMFISQIAD